MPACILCKENPCIALPSEKKFYEGLVSRTFCTPWVICKNCALMFRHPMPDVRYTEAELFKQGKNFFVKKERLENQFYHIMGNVNLSNKASILDIGCGSGVLLSFFKKRGFRVFGIEADPDAASYARKKIGHQNIYKATFEEYLKKNKQKFDLIILSHVLEHVKNPVFFLNKIKRCLQDNGYLYIEVPYELGYQLASAALLQEPFPPFHALHLYSFTHTTLMKLLQKVNFNPVSFSIFDIAVYNPEFMKCYLKMPALRVMVKKEKANEAAWESQNSWTVKRVFQRLREINAHSTTIHRKFKKFLMELKTNNTIVIYGTGLHTTLLLRKFPILLDKTSCFVDDDSKKHGTTFSGKTIISLKQTKSMKFYKILISSSLYEESMAKKAQQFISKNKIQTLYDIHCDKHDAR